MRLVNISRVEEITGLCRAAIGHKVKYGSFPKQYSGSPGTMKPYLWNEKTVIKWVVDFEATVLDLNKKKYAASTIARMANSTKAKIKSVLEKYGISDNVEQEKKRDLFHLVLSTSSQLNRGL